MILVALFAIGREALLFHRLYPQKAPLVVDLFCAPECGTLPVHPYVFRPLFRSYHTEVLCYDRFKDRRAITAKM